MPGSTCDSPTVVSAGLYTGVAERTHVVDACELLLVRFGELTIRAAGARRDAAAGCILFVPAGQLHQRAGTVSTAWVTFDAAAADVPHTVSVYCAGPSGRRARWMEDLCELADWRGPLQWKIANPLLAALLNDLTQTPDQERPPRHPALELAVGYLAGHRAQAVSMTRVARAAGVSSRYLAQLFARDVGVAPLQYHLRVRMEEATRRLLRPGISVKSVAYDLGYSDVNHFVRQFRKFYGSSPGKWRSQFPHCSSTDPRQP